MYYTVSSLESVAFEIVFRMTSPEDPFQEPLTHWGKNLVLFCIQVYKVLLKYNIWQLLQIQLSCIHMTK